MATVDQSSAGCTSCQICGWNTFTDASADFMQVCMCACACAGVAMTLINPYPDIWHDTACTAVS